MNSDQWKPRCGKMMDGQKLFWSLTRGGIICAKWFLGDSTQTGKDKQDE